MGTEAGYRALARSATRSKKLSAISDSAERLYYRMLAGTDSYGCLQADPWDLKMHVAPAVKAMTEDVIAAALDELDTGRLVQRWEVDGVPYAHLLDFDKYQPKEFLRKRGTRHLPEPPTYTGPSDLVRPIADLGRTKGGPRPAPEVEQRTKNQDLGLASSSTVRADDAPAAEVPVRTKAGPTPDQGRPKSDSVQGDDEGGPITDWTEHWTTPVLACLSFLHGDDEGKVNAIRDELCFHQHRRGYTGEAYLRAAEAFAKKVKSKKWKQNGGTPMGYYLSTLRSFKVDLTIDDTPSPEASAYVQPVTT